MSDKFFIEETSERTVGHYEANAEAFRAGTLDHDVSQNVAALLQHISGVPPFRILDLGCGPGRDLTTFKQLGHEAIGVEGAKKFVKMARSYSGCEVWRQDFLALDLPAHSFDGIFANAVLFHVPSASLSRVLGELRDSLKPGGVLFTSNPRGRNEEVWTGERFGCYSDLERWREFLAAARFTEIDHYYRPAGLPRVQQAWLATIWRNS
jgi:SAM-dependent methyltransferase